MRFVTAAFVCCALALSAALRSRVRPSNHSLLWSSYRQGQRGVEPNEGQNRCPANKLQTWAALSAESQESTTGPPERTRNLSLTTSGGLRHVRRDRWLGLCANHRSGCQGSRSTDVVRRDKLRLHRTRCHRPPQRHLLWNGKVAPRRLTLPSRGRPTSKLRLLLAAPHVKR